MLFIANIKTGVDRFTLFAYENEHDFVLNSLEVIFAMHASEIPDDDPGKADALKGITIFLIPDTEDVVTAIKKMIEFALPTRPPDKTKREHLKEHLTDDLKKTILKTLREKYDDDPKETFDPSNPEQLFD